MVGIKDEVEQLLDISAWHKLLSIEELAYRDLTLEFLASFKCRIGYNVCDDPLTIHFHLKGKVYHLSYIDLALLMGIYTPEYTVTKEYRNLISSPPLWKRQCIRWRRLSDCGLLFRPSLTASTTLNPPAL